MLAAAQADPDAPMKCKQALGRLGKGLCWSHCSSLKSLEQPPRDALVACGSADIGGGNTRALQASLQGYLPYDL